MNDTAALDISALEGELTRMIETAADEAAVGQAERPHRGVEALDPQRPEGALAALAVAVGVLVGLFHRLFGDADGVLAPAVETLGGLEDFLVLGVGRNAPFDAGHG